MTVTHVRLGDLNQYVEADPQRLAQTVATFGMTVAQFKIACEKATIAMGDFVKAWEANKPADPPQSGQ